MAGLKSAPLWFLVSLWYGSAALAVTSSRSILKSTGLPFCLSASQFILSTLLSYSLLNWFLPYLTKGLYKPMLREYSEKPEGNLIRSIALTYTLGFVLTNISLSLCNASFSETVKSGEPISSLILATLTRGEDAVSSMEWFTTLPIVIGVGLSSYSESSFHILGFLSAAASNFMFSMRGINTKQLRRLHGTPLGLDDIHLFYYISKFGAFVVVPIALVFEGRALFRLIHNAVPLPLPTIPSSMHIEVEHELQHERSLMASLLMNATNRILRQEEHFDIGNNVGSIIDPSPDILIDYETKNDESYHIHSVSRLLGMMLFNGYCYFLYNQASFMVLGRVKFVTHVTLNVMRRVFIIVFTSWWFSITISTLNMIGIVFALSGFALFLYLRAPGNNTSSVTMSSPLPI